MSLGTRVRRWSSRFAAAWRNSGAMSQRVNAAERESRNKRYSNAVPKWAKYDRDRRR